mgnify:CR=1 FL=1
MRILHVFPIFSLQHGAGVASVIFSLCKALKARGHEVTVLTSNYRFDPAFAARLSGVEVMPMRSLLSAQGFFITPGLGRWLDRRLPGFDVVHLHVYRSYQSILSHRYCGKHGVPYVLDPHGAVLRFDRKRRVKRIFDTLIGRRVLADACRIVAETHVSAEELRTVGADTTRVVVMAPPLDTEDFSVLPPQGTFRRAYAMEGKRLVMYLGRIAWIKGIDFLVEGFNQLIGQDRPEDVHLVLAGPDQGFKGEVQRMIARLDIGDRVTFTGFLDGEMKLAALQDADVVVQTSRFESWGLAPFEAILCGTPIVVTKGTGLGEAVSRLDAGYVVPFGDKKELADALARALDDRSEIQAKAERAKSYIQTHMSLSARVHDYEELYAACTGARGRA